MIKINKHTSGVVSLFVVLFATLLITVVTIGYVKIIVGGQQEATSSDLSQSAYDSALAGVEDAKRAVLRYDNKCSQGLSTSDCIALKSSIVSDECNSAVKTLSDIKESSNGEVVIDNGANQAYSCVKVQLDTKDYVGSLSKDESKIIPLFSTGDFDTVQIQWFNLNDLSSTESWLMDLPSSSSFALYKNWASTTPSVMRAQLIQFGDSFNLGDFDGNSNASTLFLYPSKVGLSTGTFVSDSRSQGKNLTITPCVSSLAAGGYACSIKLSLPTVSSRHAFLRLTSFYNATHYRISLFNNSTPVSTPVNFDNVQPQVDSNGRAGTLFRRVSARIETTDNFVYPEAAVDLGSDFCKNFMVTNNAHDYYNKCDNN